MSPISDALVEVIRDEIRATGPMTFARFMELALAHPTLGYYAQPAARPTREGDFLTAPELHPVFGRALARQVDECWRLLDRPDPFTLREYGAGAGTLAAAVAAGLRADGSDLLHALRYDPVELNVHRRLELEGRLASIAPEVRLAKPGAGTPIVGLVLANEYVDALPVHRVLVRDGRLREILVGWEDVVAEPLGGRLVDVEADPTTPALGRRLASEGVVLVEGQRAEVRLADGPWLDEVSHDLVRGYVLVVDYGAPASELHDPRRRFGGTLLAYRAHRAHADVLADPGEQDLTAHVDITALETGAVARGLVALGRTTQARLLLACGLGGLLEEVRSDPATTLERYLALRSAIARLLDPRAMGGFAVVALGRDLPPGAEHLRCLGGPRPE